MADSIAPAATRNPLSQTFHTVYWRMTRSKTKKDHVIAVIKAGLNAVPVVGGSIASLIDAYVPTSTERSIEKTLNLLAEKLTSLEGRIDVEAVNKEDFSELFLLPRCYSQQS